MLGLLILSPWVEKIMAGEKTWEIRGSRTNVRGEIRLIRSKADKKVVGTAEVVDCIGPLTRRDLLENMDKHRMNRQDFARKMPYPNTYAWVIRNAKPLEKPVPYKHPSGAVIWVKLGEDTTHQLPKYPGGKKLDMVG
jgi:hypothetical protein